MAYQKVRKGGGAGIASGPSGCCENCKCSDPSCPECASAMSYRTRIALGASPGVQRFGSTLAPPTPTADTSSSLPTILVLAGLGLGAYLLLRRRSSAPVTPSAAQS